MAVLWLTWLCVCVCVCTCCACDGASRRPPRAGARHASRRARAGARVIVVDSGHGTRVSHGVRAQCVCCTYLRLPANLCRVGVCTALHDDCMAICMATAAAATTQASERRQSDCRGQTASLSWDCLATASLQASETRRSDRGQLHKRRRWTTPPGIYCSQN